MTVFVDTSALFALLDAEDSGHSLAFPAWGSGIDECAGFVTTNYVLVETISLVQRRLGIDAVRILIDEMLPMIDTIWVTDADHATSLSLLLMAGPGIRPGCTVAENVHHWDVAPTLCSRMGWPAPANAEGRVIAHAFDE